MEEEAGLAICLFGGFEVKVRREAVKLPSRRAAWLLAILALRRGSPIERRDLAGMLWPDSSDAGGLHNLRQGLAALRRALGPAGERIQTVSPRSILLRPGAGLWVDVSVFDDALHEGRDVEMAAHLYRGPLLSDCDEPFAIREREPRERAFLSVADQLGAQYAAAREFSKATEIYERALLVDPYRESATRGLMACLAHSGETAAALDAYRKLSRLFRRDLNLDPDPETKALYRSIRTGLDKPNLRPRNNAFEKGSLPRPLTALIARETEVKEISTLLDRCRLVTLTGVGGVGKTRLALAVAEAVEEKYLDRPVFVDLSPVRSPGGIAATIAGALGVPEDPGRSAIETLSDWLRDQPRLILLDNCEHLVEGVADVVEVLLSASPHVQALATSRQPIGVAGELVWRTQPLAFPGPHTSPEENMRSPSVRLFLERSALAGRTKTQLDDEVRTISSICRRLDGLPLAIELAAARTNLLTLREIEERLDDRFAILAGSSRSVPRHRTLRAAVEWSWDLLTGAERTLLEVLSVFRGGATLSALEAVAGFPVLDLLSSLVDKSLVVSNEDPDGSRFTMLETIRQFASGSLERAGGSEDVRERHGDYYEGWAKEASKRFQTADEPLWFERLERDHDNLRSVLEWRRSRGQYEEEMRLAVRLSRFWDTHGHLSEGRNYLERSLKSAIDGFAPDLVAAAHQQAGWMATVQQDCEAAKRHYECALAYFRQSGDRLRTALNLNCLALTGCYLGEYPTAQAQYEEALEIFREIGPPSRAATVLANLGEMALKMNDPAKAQAWLEQSVAEGGGLETDDLERRGLTLSSLAVAELRRGRKEEAKSYALRSLRTFVEAQAFVSIPRALELLGIVEGTFHAWDRAIQLLASARNLADSQGLPLLDLVEPEREKTVTTALSAIGRDRFQRFSESAGQLSLNEAIDYALAGN